MKSISKIGIFLVMAGTVGLMPAFAQAPEDDFFQQWVDYRDGEVSVAFSQTPVELALSAIRARTGFQIDVPSAGDSRLLNLQLTRLPLEPAVRHVISSIGYQNFAVMYDGEGKPNRAIVLAARLDDRPSLIPNAGVEAETAAPIPLPLTPEEHEKMQKELERWKDLKNEERGRIEDRLKALPASEEREQLVKEYGRQLLGIKK
jgi:hypothetical protein